MGRSRGEERKGDGGMEGGESRAMAERERREGVERGRREGGEGVERT